MGVSIIEQRVDAYVVELEDILTETDGRVLVGDIEMLLSQLSKKGRLSLENELAVLHSAEQRLLSTLEEDSAYRHLPLGLIRTKVQRAMGFRRKELAGEPTVEISTAPPPRLQIRQPPYITPETDGIEPLPPPRAVPSPPPVPPLIAKSEKDRTYRRGFWGGTVVGFAAATALAIGACSLYVRNLETPVVPISPRPSIVARHVPVPEPTPPPAPQPAPQPIPQPEAVIVEQQILYAEPGIRFWDIAKRELGPQARAKEIIEYMDTKLLPLNGRRQLAEAPLDQWPPTLDDPTNPHRLLVGEKVIIPSRDEVRSDSPASLPSSGSAPPESWSPSIKKQGSKSNDSPQQEQHWQKQTPTKEAHAVPVRLHDRLTTMLDDYSHFLREEYDAADMTNAHVTQADQKMLQKYSHFGSVQQLHATLKRAAATVGYRFRQEALHLADEEKLERIHAMYHRFHGDFSLDMLLDGAERILGTHIDTQTLGRIAGCQIDRIPQPKQYSQILRRAA